MRGEPVNIVSNPKPRMQSDGKGMKRERAEVHVGRQNWLDGTEYNEHRSG
jgi:hypothetical protein